MKIEFGRIEPQDTDAVRRFFCTHFLQGSVLHQCLGVSVEEYEPVLRSVFDVVVAEGHSLKAQDERTGEIVGALLACDWFTDAIADTESLPKLKPMAALLSSLARRYEEVASLTSGEAILVDMAVTDPACRGRGIYRTLRTELHKQAKHAGFRLVLGELSSAATQHVCVNHFGHMVKAEIAYQDFEFHGARPFQTIATPPTIQLVEGVL